MTCLANNDGLLDLFDIANLGVYNFRTERTVTEQPRFAAAPAPRSTSILPHEYSPKPEEDLERWDGLS